MAGIGHRGFMGRNKGCSDSDGQAFITAAGITDPTQQAAICQLVKDLKGIGSTPNNSNIWGKFLAIFPMMGVSDYADSFNLVNTSTFLATFENYVTHSSDGVVSDGNGYVTFGFTGGAWGSIHKKGIDVWVSDDFTPSSNQYTQGTLRTGTNSRHYLLFHSNGNIYYPTGGIQSPAYSHGGNTKGFWSSQLTDSDINRLYKNGVEVSNYDSSASTFIGTSDGYALLARSGQTITDKWTNCPLSVFAFREELTTTEMTDWYSAVLTFQTSLGRN